MTDKLLTLDQLWSFHSTRLNKRLINCEVSFNDYLEILDIYVRVELEVVVDYFDKNEPDCGVEDINLTSVMIFDLESEPSAKTTNMYLGYGDKGFEKVRQDTKLMELIVDEINQGRWEMYREEQEELAAEYAGD